MKLSRLFYHLQEYTNNRLVGFLEIKCNEKHLPKKICTLNTADCYYFMFVVKIRLIPKWGKGRVGDRGGRAQFSYITKLKYIVQKYHSNSCSTPTITLSSVLFAGNIFFCFCLFVYMIISELCFLIFLFLSRQYVTVVVGGDENQSHKIS